MTATSPPPSPEPAGWRWIVAPLVVFGLACGIFAANARLVTLAPAWITFEFCQYAEIGRNLATEGAYNTRVVEPMALAKIDRDAVGPKVPGRWPVVNRYPLPSGVIAALMTVFGPTRLVAAWSNGLALALLAALAFAAARSWMGTGWAWVVATLWLINPSFFGEFALLGTPDPWFAALFLAELWAWSALEPPRAGEPRPTRWRWAVGVGLLGGLCYLARYNATLFLGLQVGWLLIVRRRWREAIVVGVVALAVASPAFVDNWRHFRRLTDSTYSTWNLLDNIGAFAVEPWLYYRVPDTWGVVLEHLGSLARKVVACWLVLACPSGILPTDGVWSFWRLDALMPLALLAGPWAASKADGRWRRFARMGLALFLVQLVVFSFLRIEVGRRDWSHNARYFFWFASPAVLLGVATLRRLWQTRKGWLRALVVLAIVGQAGTMARGWWQIARFHAGRETNIGDDPIRRMIAEVAAPDHVVASTHPQVTAWFGKVPSVSLPADPVELARINRSSPTPVDYLLIDLNVKTIQVDPRWEAIVHPTGPQPTGWELDLLRDYAYILPPHLTRPIGYVALRRRAVPPSPAEANL